MPSFKIKICGLTRPKDAIEAIEFGADAIGLNFYPKSSRFVTIEQAALIVQSVRERVSENETDALALRPLLIGVFVNYSPEQIFEIVTAAGLDGVQFHGDEPPSIVGQTKELISESWNRESDCLFVRAVRTKREGSPEEIARVETEIATWVDAGIDLILLDAAVPGEFGGTGAVVDWATVTKLTCAVPSSWPADLCRPTLGKQSNCRMSNQSMLQVESNRHPALRNETKSVSSPPPR